ncbi:WxL domain-containing protein [Enterococcus gilvus]|uniref:WxL domain-containing protein n=1 Tax=Enterococcus gilvus TaxID=160453 RepID=UPI0028D02FC2|nr:WxL domain-containing protein [Enterococcus gilvus]
MNKYIAGVTAISTVLLVFISANVTVQAETSTNTTAKVQVASGGLSITALDEINFGTVTKDGNDHTQSDSKSSELSINDNRGTTETGWYLTANLEDKGQGKTGIDGMTLHLDPKKPADSSEKGTFTASDLNTDAANVVTLDKSDIDLNASTTTAVLNATLTVPKSIPANSYSGTIVWNAVDGAPV